MLKATRGAAALLACVVLGGLLTACTEQSLVVGGSSVAIASSRAFTSYNDRTSFGNTAANNSIVAATNAGFFYYDDEPRLVADESFGDVEIVNDEPFSVRYTLAEGVLWSDGVAVDGADLLLAWAANSGALTTEGFAPDRFIDDATGLFRPFPDDTVYFDGASSSGLQYVSAVPELGADGRSITLVYDGYFADWQLAFEVGLAAHVVAANSYAVAPGEDESAADAAKRSVIDAITTADTEKLAALSSTWNSAFTTGQPTFEPELLVGSGPYVISGVSDDEVELTVNLLYTGSRKPHFETVVVRTITDPLAAVTALRAGDVDVIAPTASVDLVSALDASTGVTVERASSAQFEHIDLQFSDSRNGTFDNPLVREAFLATVPRAEIVRQLVRPIDPEAEARSSFLFRPGTEKYSSAVAANGSSAFERESVARARALLEEAGVVAPRVCILFDPANPRRLDEFRLITESAEKAGFVIDDCSSSDWEGFLGVPGAYDAAIFAWNESTDAVTAPAARLKSTSTVSNFSHFASPTVDALLDELAAERDPLAQQALLERIDSELWAESYGLPLYQFPAIVAYRSTVEGIALSPLEPSLTWNLWQWQPAPTAP